MTIEQTLERIATALESVAAIATRSQTYVAVPDNSRPAGEVIPPAAVAPVASVASAAPRGRGRPPGSTAAATAAKEAAATAAPAPVAAVEADPFADPAASAPVAAASAVTEGDVRLALQALRDRVGNVTPVFKLLRDVGGVDTLPALKADKYAAIIAAAKKL